MQRERQKGNRDFGNRHIALFLSLVLLILCLVPGCDTLAVGIGGDAGSDPAAVFDSFTRDLFIDLASQDELTLNYTLADPSAYGITEAKSVFGSYSLENQKAEEELDEQLLEALKGIREKDLTGERLLTYKILKEVLEKEQAGKGLELYAEPLSPTIGMQTELPVLLAEYHFYRKESVDTYLKLLGQIDEYYRQILEFEQEKAKAGLFMGTRMADQVLASCEPYMEAPEGGLMDQSFRERLEEMPELTPEEKEDYIKKNLEVLETHFVPAYEELYAGLKQLRGSGTNELGIYYLPEGRRYYEYLVDSSIYTSFSSVNDLRKAIEEQLEKDWDAIVEVLDNNPDGLEEMWEESFFSDDPETVLTYLKKEVEKAYPALPENGYQIKYVPESLEASMSPAFYLTPPMDMPQNNVIYINRGSGSYDVLTVLAHEGYPGHLYQNVYYLGREVPEVRHALNFTAYSEGWATYVENRSYLFEDNGLGNVMGELMRRDSSVTKAVYALLDIRVNYEGWNREETASFLQQIYNLDEDTVNEIYDALIANPGNYLQYYAGCLEIERMRAEAEEKLGAAFDEKEFHTFILDMGPAPFTIIRDYFDEWLKMAKKSD